MRSSKISQETGRIFNTLSPNTRSTRSTRSFAKGLATFALGHDGTVEVKCEEQDATLGSIPSTMSDIEDVGIHLSSSRKRKRDAAAFSPGGKTTVVKTEHPTTRTVPHRNKTAKKEIKEEDEEDEEDQDTSGDPSGRSPRRALPKAPAKRSTSAGGTVHYSPPSNWEQIYSLVRAHRTAHPIAPVDTMGCEDLFWETSPPQQQRYHTLTALMLSSQTKDTVTAAAMHRLHTELVPDARKDPASGKTIDSCLTIENILACDPVHLDHLIGKVGFHNTKTKNIKAAAVILSTRYNNDIPDTIEGLVSLPGVGPKMAYLAMSAAWHQDVGIGVDVHVHRITNLWGWHATKTPEQTREWLQGWLPRDKWHEINKTLVGLGQTICLPVGRRCGECPLAGRGLCKSEVRGWVKKEERKKKGKAGTVEAEIDLKRELGSGSG